MLLGLSILGKCICEIYFWHWLTTTFCDNMGIFIAPKASLKLPEPYRFMLEIILFGVTSVALYVVDQITLAIILGMVFVINRTLIIIWKQ